jgi:hypothetical protein
MARKVMEANAKPTPLTAAEERELADFEAKVRALSGSFVEAGLAGRLRNVKSNGVWRPARRTHAKREK